MFKITSNISKHKSNIRGSVLTVSLIVMVVLAASVSAIAQITANQLANTSIRLDDINDENTGKRLIQQSIAEFEAFLDPDMAPDGELDSIEFNTMLANFAVNYDVAVTNVSGTEGFENFGVTIEGESRAYRFAYTLDTGNLLVMYAFMSTVGIATEELDPFDFSLATNGDLILNGGFYRNAGFFGSNIRFGFVSPYISSATGLPSLTTEYSFTWALSKNYFPDFNGDGNSANVYYSNSYTYCVTTCFDLGATANDNFIIEESEYIDIEGSSLETGIINDDKIITDFFGSYSFNNAVVEYVKNIGPTDNLTILDTLTINNMATVVMNNSGVPGEDCMMIKVKGKWVEVCTLIPSIEPYTDVTNELSFDPSSETEFIDFGGVFDGDLTINHDFIMGDLGNETFVVTGDLVFNNTTDIILEGMIVVLGDLLFEGESVEISGGFYVLGESRFNFDEGEGVEYPGNNAEYYFSLYSKKSIFIDSMWESHNSNPLFEEIRFVAYTEESIFVDAVNSALEIDGVLFAHAKGINPPYLMLEDESSIQVHGIFINTFNGHINSSGIPIENRNTERFQLSIITKANIIDSFLELPPFDTIAVSEGVYSFERSEFSQE